MFYKFQILKKALKQAKTLKHLKKTAKKTSNLFMHFYLGGRNFINKKGLFYAKFFEFEEFSLPSFLGGSI
jgi:hypothetical protein